MPMGGVKKKKGGGAKEKKKADSAQRASKTAKTMEDRTFGLKNKNKSKKVQQHINQVKQQIRTIGKTPQEMKAEKDKKEELKRKKEAASLLKKEKAIMVSKGEIKECPFFLKGTCRKGKACMFSHANAGKLSLYVDARDEETMENWDQATLEAAVKRKEGKRSNQTDIICNYFLAAIESRKYGHFWKCENGSHCIYRHKLPPGYVLKPKKSAEDMMNAEEARDIAEDVEEERAKLNLSECTPLTFEIFQQWRTSRKIQRDAEIEAERKAAAKKDGGKGMHVLSGRALFEFDPSMFTDDQNAADEGELESDEEGEAPAAPTQAWGEEKQEGETEEAAPAGNLGGISEEPAQEKKAEEGGAPVAKKKRRKKKKVKEGEVAVPVAAPVVDDVPVDTSLFMDDEALPDSDED